MTALQTLEIRGADIRKRLSEIGGASELTDETRVELATLRLEYTDNESRQTALKIAGDGPPTPLETRTGEGREFRKLLETGNVGAIFDAAVNHRVVDGATAELQQHYGLETNQVPLALLVRSLPDDRDLETRAATPAPANVGQMQQGIIPYVFPGSVADFLGVDSPTVPTGGSTSSIKAPTRAANFASKPKQELNETRT